MQNGVLPLLWRFELCFVLLLGGVFLRHVFILGAVFFKQFVENEGEYEGDSEAGPNYSPVVVNDPWCEVGAAAALFALLPLGTVNGSYLFHFRLYSLLFLRDAVFHCSVVFVARPTEAPVVGAEHALFGTVRL